MPSSSSTPKVNPPTKDCWKLLCPSRHSKSPGAKGEIFERRTRCTKQCCWQAKQPACSKSKWLAQMHIIKCQNEEALLSFIALASLNPKAHLLQRSPSLAMCSSPSAWSLQVSAWAPSLRGPLAPLAPLLSHNVVLLGSDFILKVSYVPLSSPSYL